MRRRARERAEIPEVAGNMDPPCHRCRSEEVKSEKWGGRKKGGFDGLLAAAWFF